MDEGILNEESNVIRIESSNVKSFVDVKENYHHEMRGLNLAPIIGATEVIEMTPSGMILNDV